MSIMKYAVPRMNTFDRELLDLGRPFVGRQIHDPVLSSETRFCSQVHKCGGSVDVHNAAEEQVMDVRSCLCCSVRVMDTGRLSGFLHVPRVEHLNTREHVVACGPLYVLF